MNIIELLDEVIHDSLPMLPFLFITYFLLEYLEHKNSFDMKGRLLSLRRYGPLFGAVLGIIPQCGFSVIASGLYVDGAISIGTLLAVFISTSDEAIPILLAHPQEAKLLPIIILIKLVIAIIVGYLVDIFLMKHHHRGSIASHEYACSCDEEHGSVVKNATIRTLKIFLFVFVVNFLLTALITWIGEDQLSRLLFGQSYLQPFFAAIIGFVPNCAASVILAQLYISSIVSFGSLLAGLISSAGLGLMVLLKVDKNRKEVCFILLILFLTAFVSGSLLQLLA